MIINRYIAKHIVLATLFVILVVAGLSFFITLLGELKEIGIGDYGFKEALLYVVMRLPYTVYQFFPMLVLVGGMIGLSILATHRELIVMRASGFSVFQVVRAVFIAALVLVFFATLLGEWVAPHANFFADKRKDNLQNSGQVVATATGVWMHEGNNFLHIDRVIGLKHLEGVTRYEFNNQHQLLAAYFAKKLDYENKTWQLHDLVKTTFSEDHAVSESVPQGTWNLALNPALLNVGIILPEEMTLRTLWRYAEHLVENHSQASDFQFEFWKRLFQPFTTFVMILLAIPFVFGSPRSVTMGLRILLGVLVGFAFYMLNALFGQLSVVFQLPPFVAAILPTVLFGMVGYFCIVRLL